VFEKWMDKRNDYIFLASDTFVSADIYEYCQHAITTTKNFRHIRTPDDYDARLSEIKHNKQRYKSEKLTLLSRGTILYPNNSIASLVKVLEHASFQQIGYNNYFIHSKKQTL